MKTLFFISGLLSIYSYFLYPIILKLIPARRTLEISNNTNNTNNTLLSMSLIITVHNEASRIREKIENSLKLEYPDNLLEIIVASDFSTDNTESIVDEYADKGIQLVCADERKGKEYAQLCAIREANGKILVFSDVATSIEKDALINLGRRFLTDEIGAISSEDRFVSQNGEIAGEGAYVAYEMWLRALESTRAGLVGLSGSFFAARAEVCEQWDISVPSDFNTALNCAKSGFVAISCSDVVGIYQDVKDPALEYRRKTRTVIRGINAIVRHLEVLNPFTMRLFAFQVWSHKVMRWLAPWFILLFLASSIVLYSTHWFFDLASYGQVIFYSLVLLGYSIPVSRNKILVKIPYFFVQVNIAIAHATLKYLFGTRITVWEPSKR